MSKLAARFLLSIFLFSASSSISVLSSEAQVCAPDVPHIEGEWTTLPYLMPINPISTTLLRNGKVLLVPGSENDAWNNSSGSESYRYAIWDPAGTTQSSITVNNVPYDVFCSGTAVLPDGRALVVGGTSNYVFTGDNRSSIFDPVTGSFLQSQNMANGRWYGTITALGDGRIMAFSGLSLSGGTNNTVEIYDLKSAGAGWSSPATAPFTPPLYPRMFLLPNGKVFFNGYGDGTNSNARIFDPTPRTWTISALTTTERFWGSAVLLPLLAPSYTPKVINFGGGGNSSTEIIDLSVASPSYTAGPNMSTGRVESNAVILPNGKVLVTGGSVNDEVPDAPGRSADLYDPATNTFSSGGTASFSRLYHSTALLLPDATVASMGSNPGSRASYEPAIEIYRPPYLFNANDEPVTDRPIITSVSPGVIGYNSSFSVNYSSTLAITSAVLVRPGSSTHASDMEQRLIGLCGPTPQPACNGTSGTLTVTSPPNGNIAPPGYYMLFLLDSAGVPSIAQFIQLSLYTTVPPDGAITSPASNPTITAGQAVSFSTTTTAAQYSWIFPGGSTPTSTAQNPGSVTFNTPGTYVVSLTVIDSSGNSDPSPATRTITVLPTTANSNFSIAMSPTSVAVVPGQSAAFTVTVTSLAGFKGTVNLSVGSESGFPSGITSGGFSPASINAPGSSTLTMNTSTSAKPYALSLTITGTSGTITHTSSTTLIVNLSPPASLNATAGNAQVALSWPATSGANGYNIKRAPIAGGPYVTVGCATGTSFTDSGLVNGKTYYYVVSATYTGNQNGGGESRNSSEASATPQAATPPPPTGLAAAPGNGIVALTWNASSGASSYNVKRATVSGGPYAVIASPFSTTHTDSTVSNGTTYYYVVSAVNSAGESANSGQVSATPQASYPTITSLSPSSKTAGSGAFTLTVNGTNFVSGSVVQWNGTPRTTTLVGSTQVTAAILASDIASVGTAQIRVVNSGGGTSNVLTFTINANTSGLVAAYGFNEGTGSMVADASGSNNTGTINGASWTTQGKYGNALSFDGVSNYVNIRDTFLTTSQDWSISGWVKGTNLATYNVMFVNGDVADTGKGGFQAGINKFAKLYAGVVVGVDSDEEVVSLTTLNANTWYHVGFVKSGTAVKIYLNGTLDNTGTLSTATMDYTATTPKTRIGIHNEDGDPFAGLIDNVRIYNRALTQAEIQNDMNTPIGAATNTAPTISTIAAQSTNEDTATGAIAFTVDDGQTAVGSLTVSGSSSNTTLIPNANIVFGGSGANRTVTVTPALNQNGTATITVTVSDGQLSTPTSFLLTVNSVNDSPTIANIANQTTTVGIAVGPINFTVGDVETAAGSLTLSGSSNNTTLVPNANITFGGSGANRTVTVMPASGQTGTATITVTVNDGQTSTPTSFLLTVNATNTAPTISSIAAQTTNEDTATSPIAFTVGDAETTPGSLTVSGSSSNTILVPNANIVLGGSGANRTVAVTPALNQNGTATITVTVSDGQLSTPTSFFLTVNAANDAPTITAIANQTTSTGAAVGPINFTVGDVETAAGSLTVSGSSSNTTLVPNANITFGGSGANRTVTVTPAAGQTGTATITVTVSDGQLSTPTSFVVTVNALPAGVVAAYALDEFSGTLTADSSGNNNAGIVNGATFTTQGKYGNALSFDGVNDYVNILDTFIITSQDWSISGWVNGTNLATYNVMFVNGDVAADGKGGFQAGINKFAKLYAGVVVGVDSDEEVVSLTTLNANTWYHVGFVKSGTAVKIYLNGTLDNTGTLSTATMDYTATTPKTRIGIHNEDGDPFAGLIDNVRIYNRALTQAEIQNDMNTPIGSVANTAPTISTIAAQSTNEDTATSALPFMVGDGETAPGSLTVSGSSSNTTLIPNANITFGGSGANRTVTVTPALNQNGTATITVTVSDGQLSTPTSFLLTVNAVNDAPTITTISDQSTTSGTAVGPISFTIGDVETAAGSLTVSGSSSNTTLVPNANITFGGSGANRTVTVTPAAGQTGTATITVTVSDSQMSTPTSFLVTVTASNTAPTISTIAPQITNEDTATGALAFTVDDTETAVASLTVTGSSNNTTLVPNANIVFGGSGANRTVTVTPALNQNGTATITVTVSDGQLSTPTSFLLTVNAVNDAPTITTISDQSTTSGTAVGPISFTIGDVETAAGSLTVSGSSTNTTLVPDANIVFGGSAANRTVTVTPAAGQSGTATITVAVSDSQMSTPTSFLVTVTADTTAPETSLTATPSNPSTSNNASFSFTSTEPGNFQCQLDSSGFAACNSPQNYTGLSQGSHNFQVQAIDLAGNLDLTPASYSWMIDSIAPDTTLTGTPSNPSNSSSASFSFTSTEAGSFQCQLDGAIFAPCTSPKSYIGLTQGSHTFQVQAVDLADNIDSTPASYTWTYTPVTLFPTGTTIETGTFQSGNAASLNADDNNYFQVNSTTSGTITTSWYGSFTGVSSNLSNLKVTYKGKNSRNCTQTIAIWRWTDSTWVQLDSRNVGTSEVQIANLTPSGTLSNYVSPTGEIRVRVRCTRNSGTFFSSGDLMPIVYDIP